MSDDYQYIDVNDEQWEGTPRELRQALDKAQNKLREVTKQVATFEAERASNALSGVLTGYKNPDRVKAAILGDKVDPLDNEAVTKWLEANGDDYAKGQADPDPVPNEGEEDLADQYEALQLGGAYRPAADIGKLQAANAEITPDMDGAAVAAVYAKHGI